MSAAKTEDAYRHLDQMAFSTIFPDAAEGEALRVSRLVRKRWPELEKEIPLELYPDVEPTLRTLGMKGYTLGLISNAPADTKRVVKPLGLDRFMSTLVFSGAVGFTKPHPEIFRIAMKDAGVSPQESVHVGDIFEADVVGARNAGMKGLLIDRLGDEVVHDCPRMTSLDQIYGLL